MISKSQNISNHTDKKIPLLAECRSTLSKLVYSALSYKKLCFLLNIPFPLVYIHNHTSMSRGNKYNNNLNVWVADDQLQY